MVDKEQIKEHLETLFPAQLETDEWLVLDYTEPDQPKKFIHSKFFKDIEEALKFDYKENVGYAVHPTTKKAPHRPTAKKDLTVYKAYSVVVDIDNFTSYYNLRKALEQADLMDNVQLVVATGGGFQVVLPLKQTVEGLDAIKDTYRQVIDKLTAAGLPVDNTSLNVQKGQRLAGTVNIKYPKLAEIVYENKSAEPLDVAVLPSNLSGYVQEYKAKREKKETDIIKQIKHKFSFYDLFPELKDHIARTSSQYDLLHCPIHQPDKHPSAVIYHDDGFDLLIDFHPDNHKGVEYPDFLAVRDGYAIFDVIDYYAFKNGLTLKEAVNELKNKMVENQKKEITDIFKNPDDLGSFFYYDTTTAKLLPANLNQAKHILRGKYGIKNNLDVILYGLPPAKPAFNPTLPFGYLPDKKVFNQFRKSEHMINYENKPKKIGIISEIGLEAIKDAELKTYFKNIAGEQADEAVRALAAFTALKLAGKKVGHAIIFSTFFGAGKSSVLPELFKPLFQDGYVWKTEQTYLFGSFNYNLVNRYVVFVEEMHVSDKEKDYERFKVLITENKLLINKKNVPEFEVDNFMDFIGFSNNATPVLIKDRGERRYIIFRNSQGEVLGQLATKLGYTDFDSFVSVLVEQWLNFVEDYIMYFSDKEAKLYLEALALQQAETIKKEMLKDYNPLLLVVEEYQNIEEYVDDEGGRLYSASIEAVKSGQARTQDIINVLRAMGYHKYTAQTVGRQLKDFGLEQFRDKKGRYWKLDKTKEVKSDVGQK